MFLNRLFRAALICFGVLAVSFSPSVMAEGVLSGLSFSISKPSRYQISISGNYWYGTTPTEACQSRAASATGGNVYHSNTTTACLLYLPPSGSPFQSGTITYTPYCPVNYSSFDSTTCHLSSCPTNATFTGGNSCVCNTGYEVAPGGVSCQIPACPAVGTLLHSGFYDVGTNPAVNAGTPREGFPPFHPCSGGCEVEYTGGDVAWRSLVGGVYHYYAEGSYSHTGATCTGDAPPSSAVSIPAPTCGADQSLVTGSNGFARCYDGVAGGFVDSNSASAVAAAESAASAQAASQVTAAQSVAQAAGLSASGVEQAQAVAAGVGAVGGSVGGASAGSDPVMNQFCADNPQSSLCAAEDFGTVSETALGERSISVAITPVAVGSAGSCPAPSPLTINGHTEYFQWTTYCNFANGIKPILLAFAWLSAAGLLVGGFRTA